MWIDLRSHRSRFPIGDLRAARGHLGLLPGVGGITRTVRMRGLEAAPTNVLLPGRPPRAIVAAAAEGALVDFDTAALIETPVA